MRKTVKASEVWSTRAKFKAVAECAGVNNEGCPWQPFWPQDDKNIRTQAKKHVQNTPTHRVNVIVEDVTTYYVPSAILGKEEE